MDHDMSNVKTKPSPMTASNISIVGYQSEYQSGKPGRRVAVTGEVRNRSFPPLDRRKPVFMRVYGIGCFLHTNQAGDF